MARAQHSYRHSLPASLAKHPAKDRFRFSKDNHTLPRSLTVSNRGPICADHLRLNRWGWAWWRAVAPCLAALGLRSPRLHLPAGASSLLSHPPSTLSDSCPRAAALPAPALVRPDSGRPLRRAWVTKERLRSWTQTISRPAAVRARVGMRFIRI